MKAQIVHLPQNKESVEQATQALKSFQDNGWDVDLLEVITPETLETNGRVTNLLKGGRLTHFKDPKLSIKKSCVNNHIVFWEKVYASNETMAFIEHDALAVRPPEDWTFDDVLILNMQYAFNFGALQGKRFNKRYPLKSDTGVHEHTDKYPLKCKVPKSPYKGSKMMPGTAAYAITPQGARKMLDVVYNEGIDQSDYIMNSKIVKMEYVVPSPVKFNTKNLRTSHG